jgi:hypothetical protein
VQYKIWTRHLELSFMCIFIQYQFLVTDKQNMNRAWSDRRMDCWTFATDRFTGAGDFRAQRLHIGMIFGLSKWWNYPTSSIFQIQTAKPTALPSQIHPRSITQLCHWWHWVMVCAAQLWCNVQRQLRNDFEGINWLFGGSLFPCR